MKYLDEIILAGRQKRERGRKENRRDVIRALNEKLCENEREREMSFRFRMINSR